MAEHLYEKIGCCNGKGKKQVARTAKTLVRQPDHEAVMRHAKRGDAVAMPAGPLGPEALYSVYVHVLSGEVCLCLCYSSSWHK
jgi:hypothetical protein